MPKDGAPPSVLITGAAGLVGTATRTAFENQGWKVSTLDQREQDLDGRPIEHVCNILTTDLEEKLLNVVGIIHLAAVSRVIEAELNQELCTRTNVEGTSRILSSASATRCNWLIFASSREVYGEPVSLPVHEEDTISPINHYGRGKVVGERMVQRYCNSNGLSQSIMRFSNIYGHHADYNSRIVNSFIRRALSGEDLRIHGGDQILDLIHVDDAATAIMRAAEQLQSTHNHLPLMNVATGVPISIEQLVKIISEKTGVNVSMQYLPRNQFSATRFCGNPTRMRKILGFHHSIDLSIGIEREVESLRNLRKRQAQ